MASTLGAAYHTLTEPLAQISLASVLLVVILVSYFVLSFTELSLLRKSYNACTELIKFAYNCFLKPHSGDGSGSQQDALESFYKAQASIYDATRTWLLQGREDMLALCAAQLKYRQTTGQIPHKPIWVDCGGGTGWNIEQMQQYLDVPNFFHAVYMVDLSPSLCEVARERFNRLGWGNIRVICEDARVFRLSDYESEIDESNARFSIGKSAYDQDAPDSVGADLLTMSYSLSMIPEFHPAIDSITNLLSPAGIVGVVDFYVQNRIEFQNRNYIGSAIDRHCMWISRVFWRTWFELDRVNLDSARRDYMEYKFGTILSTNRRCRILGFRIPYYIFIGCARDTSSSIHALAALDASVTESPFITALGNHARASRRPSSPSCHSKGYESAVVNLAASLPLPAAYYQNHKTRIYYDDALPKHRQFNDEYIYAFTWEDSRADARILKITSDDVILAITSAGDNILSYALERPKRIHAVDLNPAQNHLLELKVAAYRCLPYADFWKLFGEGTHPSFTSLLLERISPHLSSQAFDYWLHHGPSTFSPSGKGLYYTGGSRHALKLVSWLGKLLGIRKDILRLSAAQTLNEQREIWTARVRRVLLSRLLAYFVVGSEAFLWKALGVPGEQRAMIEEDYKVALAEAVDEKSGNAAAEGTSTQKSGQAIWHYGVQTLDPVVNQSLISEDNHYYLVCLLGHYTPQNHPTYLTPRSHALLSSPSHPPSSPLNNLRIHTDALSEVFARMQPASLTIAVLMDSMDWFSPTGSEAREQVRAVNRALKVGGRVLLRSAGRKPWYVGVFEGEGFVGRRVGVREAGPGKGGCVDRVNMYASTWVCTKVAEVVE